MKIDEFPEDHLEKLTLEEATQKYKEAINDKKIIENFISQDHRVKIAALRSLTEPYSLVELMEATKPFCKMYEDNLHHIKARDILKDAIQAAIHDSNMTPEVIGTGKLFLNLLELTDETFKYDANTVIVPIKEIVEKYTKSQSGKNAVNAKLAKTHDIRAAAKEAIKNMWASGKYTSRDICAEQEWEAAGFNSWKTARKALTNTPDPSPWPELGK